MDGCLGELVDYMSSRKSRYNGDIVRFSRFILSNVVIHQGCYLFEYAIPRGLELNPTQEFSPDEHFPDRTGYECSENHVHTQDILRSNKPGLHHLATAVSLAEILRLKLCAFANVQFRIIVGFPVKPLVIENKEPTHIASRSIWPNEEDNQIRDDSTVRFHAVRNGEVIYDDLEAFRFDAMGVMEV